MQSGLPIGFVTLLSRLKKGKISDFSFFTGQRANGPTEQSAQPVDSNS
jgi:hypothetical protein